MSAGPWTWLIYPAGSVVPLGELTDAHERSLTARLIDSSESSFTVDARHDLAQLPDELVTDLVIAYNGEPVFRGRVGASSDDVDLDEHRATFTAVDYLGLLRRRSISTPQAPWTFTTVAQGSIVRQLIAWTQGTTGGDLGISATSATVPDTAITRTIVYEPVTNIGEAIIGLAALENGFDFWVDADLVAQLAYPQRGQSRDLVLEYGATIAKVTRSFDPTIYGNSIMVTGAAAVTPKYATAGDLATRPEGRLDLVESYPDIDSSTALQSRANASLAEASTVRPAYSCQLIRGLWRPQDLWLGDAAGLVVRSGRLDVITTERVQQIDITLGEDGEEDVLITLGQPPPLMSTRIRKMTDRLGRVERLG
jgi:hypothetical protein